MLANDLVDMRTVSLGNTMKDGPLYQEEFGDLKVMICGEEVMGVFRCKEEIVRKGRGTWGYMLTEKYWLEDSAE